MIRRRLHHARAFTLLEVLMGVLILALGLLGLGAVIPVVVRTQRLAHDATAGVTIAQGAQGYLAGRADINRLSIVINPGNPPTIPPTFGAYGLGVWLLDANWSTATSPNAGLYLWEEPRTSEFDLSTGEMLWNAGNTPVILGVADRLWPPRGAARTDPHYVWDFVGRRLPLRAGEPPRVQIAVFVRRIDQRIRVPAGWTLYEVLADKLNVPFASQRLPVAVDGAGLPTNTGVNPGGNVSNAYATPVTLDVVYSPLYRDRLLLASGSTDERTLARQVGQRLVDNLGNVYVVQGVEETDPSLNTVLIDPPVPAWVPDPGVAQLSSRLRQVVFTPQVPAAVLVFNVTPQDPK